MKSKSSGAEGLGVGIAIGVALGAAMGNVGLGVALGVAMGAAIGAAQRRKPVSPSDRSDESGEEPRA